MVGFQRSIGGACAHKGRFEVVLDVRPCSVGGVSAQPLVGAEAATELICQIVHNLLPKDYPGASYDRSSETADSLEGLPQWPVLSHLSPCVLQLPASCRDGFNAASDEASLRFIAHGVNLHAPGTQISVICQGRHIPLTVLIPTEQDIPRDRQNNYVILSCPIATLPCSGGMLHVIARQGKVTCDPCKLLLMPDAGMVAELSQLPAVMDTDEDLQDIIHDLGQWTDVVQGRRAALASNEQLSQQQQQRLASAAGSVDVSGQMAHVLVLNAVERAMAPTAVDLLHFFVQHGWEECACAMLNDLLNADLQWAATPNDMWRHLNAPGADMPPLMEAAMAGSGNLATRFLAIAKSAGCHKAAPEVHSHPRQEHGATEHFPTTTDQLSPLDSLTASSITCPSACSSAWHSNSGVALDVPGAAFRSPSALSSLVGGFPDPQMEEQHRRALHRANCEGVGTLAWAAIAMTFIEVLVVLWAGQSLTLTLPSLIWCLANFMVYQSRIRAPRVHDAYIHTWPLLLLASRVLSVMWAAASLPVNRGRAVLMPRGHAEAAGLALHVVLPAVLIRTRLSMALLMYGITAMALSLVSIRLATSTTLESLLLQRVLPCLMGLAWTVYSDYKGRVAILRHVIKKEA